MRVLKNVSSILAAAFLLAGSAACGSAAVPTAPTDTRPTAGPSATAGPTTLAAVDAQRTLTVGGVSRTYFVHVPAGLDAQQPVPLMFMFHGYQQNGKYARMYTGFDGIADAKGFIVVYPDGSGASDTLSWNAGTCCGEALLNNVDEAAFVRAILADVKTTASVDSKRTYAVGFSNGALLSYRLACTMSDTFAAVAPMSGVLTYTPCQPEHPVSVIHVHGTKDLSVPIDGGGAGLQFPPVKDSLATWAKLDNCSGPEHVAKNGVLTHTTYGTCAPGVAVEFYTVDGVGHVWPPVEAAPVSEIIWDFLASHPKP
jgi:polyhydroxybutyrate depolymerase